MHNRWLTALAALGIHISIGSVYAWSVLTHPIMEQIGCNLQEVTGVFSVAILFLGMSAGFLGNFVEKIGPKKSGLLATFLFGGGMLISSIAVNHQSLLLLYIAYGVMVGIGLGIGYITPISTLAKCFPKHKGFATGLAIMGFGFAALIGAPIMQFSDSLIDKSISYDSMYDSLPREPFKKKFLVSQNGPVWVSQWKPKKITPNNSKDYIHD